MKFADLVDNTAECIKTFNPVIKTIDSHSDDYLKNFKDPYEKVFIKQVFYGCTRYQDFLKIFTNVFFKRNTSTTNRNDATLYQIFGYLTFFRLEELAIEDYRRLILSQDSVKMNVFLQFVFNVDNLTNYLKEEWMTLYDFSYIDEKIIGTVEKNLPNVADIVRIVEKRATGMITSPLSLSLGGSVVATTEADMGETNYQAPMLTSTHAIDDGEPAPKKITEQQPFNLTKPKPKVLPQPEPIKKEIKANPVPKNMFKKTLADIEKEKEDRRKAKVESVRQQYEGNDKKRFPLQTEARTNKFEKIKQDTIRKQEDELKFNMKHARPMPDFEKKEAVVKLNTAAVLREGHHLKKHEEEEKKVLKDYEMNLRDEKEFSRWKAEMDAKEEIERLEHIQKKKIEMEMAREEAIQAQKRKGLENNLLAQKLKEELEIKNIEKIEQQQVEFEERKKVVEAVQSQKEQTAKEVEKVKDEKRKIRDEVNKELTEAAQRKKEEDAIDQAKKEELIRQIRELEKIPIVRTKGYDPTESGGHGLLEEMSVAELRERLEFNKRKEEQDVAYKREENLKTKEEQANKLMGEAAKIYEARNARKQNNEDKKLKKQLEKEELENKMRAAREKGLQEVHSKISQKKKEKKSEEDRLAKELKEIKLQRQYLNANRAMVEEKAWKELEAGAERQIRDNQNQRLIDQCKTNEIKVKDETVRATNARNTIQAKLDYDQGFNDRLTSIKKENEVLHKGVLSYKTDMHAQQKQFEAELKVSNAKRNPFNAKINEQSIANATKNKKLRNQGHQDEDYNYQQFNAMDEGEATLDLLGGDDQDDIGNKLAME